MEAVVEIKKILGQTHDVRTFVFRRPQGFSFTPGQYCLVSIPGSGDEKRPFTLASSPTEDMVELTVKEMGEFTRTMFSMKPGDRLEMDGPYGESLNFDGSVKDDIVLLAGGSGITPFMSILRYIAGKGLHNRVVLIVSNRTSRDMIYKDELNRLAKLGNINVVHTLTREEWDGETGRIDEGMIRRHVKEPERCLYYVCGPPAMVDGLVTVLKGMGIPSGRIRVEDWQVPGKGG
jgi:ferredoxin-NADP reductase